MKARDVLEVRPGPDRGPTRASRAGSRRLTLGALAVAMASAVIGVGPTAGHGGRPAAAHLPTTTARGPAPGPNRVHVATAAPPPVALVGPMGTIGPPPVAVSGSVAAAARGEAMLVLAPPRADPPAPPVPAGGEPALAASAVHGSGDATSADEIVLWAWDFHRLQYYPVRATSAYRSDSCRVYVELGRQVSAAAAQALGRHFDEAVYPRIREWYGRDPHPGVDDQAAVTILLLDILDPLHYGASPFIYYSGYFDPINERLQEDLERLSPMARSNEREMIYVDVDPTDPTGRNIRQTLAHEFAHLVLWSYDDHEADWLTEGLAELGVFLADGTHPEEHVRAFLSDPEGTLTSWDGAPRDYGRVYLFLLYLYEQAASEDAGWLRRLVRNPDDGLRAVATSYPLDRSTAELYRDFGMAVQLDDHASPGGRHAFRQLWLAPTAGPDRYAFPGLDGVSVGSRSRVELPAWSTRAARIELDEGSVKVEIVVAGQGCVGLGWRGAGPGRATRAACPEPARPVEWFVSADDGAAADLVVVLSSGDEAGASFEIGLPGGAAVLGGPLAAWLPIVVAP